MRFKNYHIYKERVGTIGPKLTLYTAFSKPRSKSRSGFVAECCSKKKLLNYLKKRKK